MKAASPAPEGRKLASLAIIPVALILIALFTVLDIRTATEPPFLLTILNTVFIGFIPLIIATIAFRSYRSGGSAGLFMMGSGMMIFGLGSIAAGWLIGLPQGTNISVAIYNVCILLSAVFYLTGALFTIVRSKTPDTAGSSWKIAAISAGIIVFMATFIFLAIAGLIPPFFITDSGPTVLRQVILSNAIILLAIASILLFYVYRQKREDFFFWYAVSLAVISVGLVAALFIPALGSPVNWISRVMQYIGAGFALIAIIVAGRLARGRGRSLEETLSRFFSDAEAGYKSLIETATDAIVVFDSNDRILVWNAAAEMMFGYSSSEAVGTNFTQLAVPDESAGLIKNNFRSHGISGKGPEVPKPVEIMVRHKDGSTFPAELTLSRHVAGGTEVSTCIIRDITERKRAEQALRESGERLRTVIENSRDGINMLDLRNGRYVVFSPSQVEMTGFTRDELEGITAEEAYERVHPEDRQISVEQQRKVAAGEDVAEPVEYRWKIKSGEYRWFSDVRKLVRDAEGRKAWLVGTSRDITDNKRADDALRASYKTFSELIESAPFGIYIIDSGFRIAMMNAGSQEGAFRNVRPLIGRDFSEAMHTLWPDDVAEEIIGHFRHTLETGEPYYSPRFTNPRYDVGIVESYEWELHRMRLPDGQYGVICYYYDSTKLRNAEEAVRRSEESLRLAQEAGNVGVWDWNLLTGEVRFTAILEAIYGRSPGSVRKYGDFQEQVHADDLGIVETTRDKAVEEHKPFQFEFRIRRPDGVTRWLSCRGRAVYDDNGKPVHIFGVNIDITEHKNAEDALRESEEKFRVLTQNLQSAVALIDEHGAFSIVNSSFLRMFGIPADADILNVNNQDWARWQVFNEDGTQLDVDQHPVRKAALKGRAVKNQLVAMKSPSGPDLKWLLISAEPVLDAHGGIHRIICTYYDITDRRKAEEELRQSEERFRLALRNAPVSVAVQDTNLVFRWAYNQRTRRTDEIVGKTDADLFAAEDVAWLTPIKHRILETGDDVHTENWLTSNGRRVYLDLYFEPLRNKNGEITGIGIAAVDLTDLKLAKDELQKKNDTLNALNEDLSSAEEELNRNVEELSQREEDLSKLLAEKDILLSEIHHRVKNNLAAFISLLGLKGSHEESPAGKSLKKDLQNRARSMALIHETLYNTHRYSEVDMEIYLSTLIGQVVNSYGSAQSVRTVIEAKGVTLDLARATPTGLIVNELVTNSLKYAFPPEFDCIALRKEPCTIRVSLVREDGTHLLTVSDNGRGLPAEIDPLATKSLGLRLVNFLAGHQLRARIEIRTDKGTEFIFRLNKREDYP